MKKRLLLFLVIFMTACQQEISTDAALPAMTSVYPTGTPQTAPMPATPTALFPAPTTLPEGAINLITIGDDLTRGEGDTLGRGYPGRLIELARQIRPGSTVTNFGQTGWTSDDLIQGKGNYSGQLLRAVTEVTSVTAQGRSAVALVWIGGNDLWELYTGTAEVTAEDEERDALRFEENIKAILFELRSAGAEVIIARLDDQAKRPAQTRHEIYPDITAAELKRMSAQVLRYNEIISKQAAENNALIVDFYGSEIFVQDDTLSWDGYHPNSAGYDIIYKEWYKVLVKILP
ncbi:hypothetical protein MASR2M66_09120 [Chloroflexota bacterium]